MAAQPREHIRCHLVYPNGPGRPDSPRTARVVFKIGANGGLSDVNIEESSGVMVFDRGRARRRGEFDARPAAPADIRVPITATLPLRYNPPPKVPLSAPSQAETPRPDEAKKEPPVCRDIGIM